MVIAYTILPIYNESKNVLNWYTTISDPKDFNYGVNIDSTRSYSVNICWSENLTKLLFNPRFIIINNNYVLNGKDYVEVDIFQYNRDVNNTFTLDKLASTNFNITYEAAINKMNDYCNYSDLSAEKFSISSPQELLQLKSDAINNPKQQVPETTLTQEEIRKQLEEQEKNESAR